MNPSQIAKSYDKIASQWNADMIGSDYGITMIDRAIKNCAEKKTALDVGCGSGGRIVNKLLENAFNLTAIDFSEGMLALAKQNHPQLTFEKADIIEWETDDRFDLIVAWDSIFHLPLEFQEPVVRKLCNFLNPLGILVYTFGDAVGAHEDTWLGEKFGYSPIGIDENLRVLAACNCQCRHLELDQYPQNHVSVIARKNS
ncbi:class I SAM-dependent methyltransferase [Pontibacter sp. HSC-14F20]|uniref:class I SAM-dependent methyltransferase n=1 Tax=Pontibacter sp. HSC-14F20 TaxID=2864136 RepID=UPI001C7374AC|nr:class I SAM-dependent methyltransferase [Pontibacter sp. HSC-14F20]MBX0332217.1 class I SAM-dependent methyltransferase [Pontibacter sp. HSC-14F20]